MAVDTRQSAAEVRNQDGLATEQLASFASSLTFDQLPQEVVQQAKRIVVDTLACIIAAHPLPGPRIMEHVLGSVSDTAEATMIPSGRQASAPIASYVNAFLANHLDLDDNLLNHTHFANTAVAGPLAVAESRALSGRDLIRAVVAAYEVSARLSLALTSVVDIRGTWPDVEIRRHKVYGQGFAVFGVAAGCGNLLGLTAAQMRHAFGSAGYSAPVPSLGKQASNSYMPMNKYAAYGSIAFSGALAALLAQAGFTADTDVLDGDRGFWRMAGSQDCDWQVLTGGLGSKWWCLETTFKVFPVCTWNRQPVEALQHILRETPFEADQVESIEVLVHPSAAEMPNWRKAAPSDYLETQMSHPYAAAMAILRIPGPLWQDPETVADPAVVELTRRVTVGVEPTAQRAYYDQTRPELEVRRIRRSPARVTVRLKDGRELSAAAEYAKGDPYTPATALSDADLREKFLGYGARVIPKDRLERAADVLFELEQSPNVKEIVRLLCV